MYKLVIIEDEHIIRKWLRYAIDYKALDILVVGEAKDGQSGAALIKECHPDIVLTDINMPIMTAFDMFEATKEQFYAKIILSGYADFPNARSAIHYGVLEFLAKPVEKAALWKSLQSVMAKIEKQKEARLQGDTTTHYLPLPKVNDQIPDVVKDMLDWVHAHFQEKITTSQLAHDLGYSESYLYQNIKKHLQMTLSDYINQYRINQAVQLMQKEPDLMVYQIAEAVGIYDYRYFDRVFKKYLGQTVKAFKEEHLTKDTDGSKS
ncbi:response regulator transcription factor [Streptococcus canis]|uniref:response regulator transcription factor n=1 Tax=Streptococcus canis TaxID=1329 RepID=UPI0012F364F4|nr:helix-turn-helix domain-containing protein [Streptococcus canis]GFE43432.1 putative two-component response regulator [Streptococcus canis]